MFKKSVEKIHLSLKSDKGTLHEDLCTLTIILSLSSSQN